MYVSSVDRPICGVDQPPVFFVSQERWQHWVSTEAYELSASSLKRHMRKNVRRGDQDPLLALGG